MVPTLLPLSHLPCLAAANSSTFSVLLGGLGTTLQVMGAALLLGLTLGLLLAIGRLSARRWLCWPVAIYVEIMRGIPLLVLLLFVYFGVPHVITLLSAVGVEHGYLEKKWYPQITEFWACVAAFGLCYGAYLSEVFRAGIQAVDAGQTEAARALGLSQSQTMIHVVLPQAVRNVLPALVNESVALLKDTSLASAIAVHEITFMAHQELSRTYDSFGIWMQAAAIYLVLTLGLAMLARVLEHRLRRGRAELGMAKSA